MNMRELLDKIPSYEKKSHEIVVMLNSFNEIDKNMFIFTSDDTEMCSDVNTEERLTFLTIALDNLIFKVNPNGPRKEIITALKLLVRFNFSNLEIPAEEKRKEERWGGSFHMPMGNINILYHGHTSAVSNE